MPKDQSAMKATRLSTAILGIAIAAIEIGASSTPSPPTATDSAAAGRTEMLKAFISMRPRPSVDTYPVEFSIGKISYRMPRNYLTTMANWNGGPQEGFATITVNIPDMKPFSADTQICFQAKPLDRPPGCEPLAFRLYNTNGTSADQAFTNMSGSFHSQAPMEGPSGFEKYEIGPDNARIEYYRKVENGTTRVYSCQIFDNHGQRDGLCRPVSDRTATGAFIGYFFNLRHLSDIFQIDADLRKLVESFTVSPGDGN
jgi:hypothetical protein